MNLQTRAILLIELVREAVRGRPSGYGDEPLNPDHLAFGVVDRPPSDPHRWRARQAAQAPG